MSNIIKNDRLKQLRKSKGYTLAQLAKLVGVTDATLQRYESGQIHNIKPKTLDKLAEILGCSATYILGYDKNIDSYGNIVLPSPKKLPVLGKIACGEPIFCDDSENAECVVSYGTNADFCLIARGDSMIDARIYDGDIVLIKEQSDVENGEIAAVIIDDEATLKRVFKIGDVITLMPANSKYEPMVFTPDQFRNIRILGKAVGMQTNNLYIERD